MKDTGAYGEINIKYQENYPNQKASGKTAYKSGTNHHILATAAATKSRPEEQLGKTSAVLLPVSLLT